MALVLCDALRASSTLRSLSLHLLLGLGDTIMNALLGSLVGHCSLRVLNLSHTHLNWSHIHLGDGAHGAALAALLAADAPALAELNLNVCNLSEADLGPLCDALPRNHHLRTLDIRGNAVPAGFMRARLLPAMRDNTGLHKLLFDEDATMAVDEAPRILAAR